MASPFSVKLVNTKHYKIGFELRTEIWDTSIIGGPDVTLRSAYNKDGDYVGDFSTACLLYRCYGIEPEKADPTHTICSIGFSEKNQAWFGWSHRAMGKFAIGDTVKLGDVIAGILPVGYEARTLEDCKRMAIAFAREVS